MVIIEAPAKLNLGLKILGQRNDGYHELDTVFVSVDLVDILTLHHREHEGITIECDHPAVPTDHRNLVWQAAKRFCDIYEIPCGVHIKIDKHIPVGGGMAGGSSDAAAVLRALPLLWNVVVEDQIMRDIARKLGADVLYCYVGGVQRGRGIGTELMQLENNCPIQLAILPQPWAMSTAAVFKAFHESAVYNDFSIDGVVESLALGNLQQLCKSLGNSLMPGAFSLEPRLGEVYERLAAEGLFVQMTGSGSTLYIVLTDNIDLARLKAIYDQEIRVFSILNALPSAIIKNK